MMMGTGAGAMAEAMAINAKRKPIAEGLKLAASAGLFESAARDWSPSRKQWQPVAIRRGARGAGAILSPLEQAAAVEFVATRCAVVEFAASASATVGDEGGNLSAAAMVAATAENRRLSAWLAAVGVHQSDGARGKPCTLGHNKERAAELIQLDREQGGRRSAVLAKRRALRAEALAVGAGEVVAMAPLGAGKASKSRQLIDKGGEAGEDEARQCLVCHRQRVEQAGAALAEAAGKLGERVGGRWVNRKESAMGIVIGWQTRCEVVAIFRAAGVAAVMSGADGLLSCRGAVKAARKAAAAEIYKAGGRDGLDRSMSTADGFEPSKAWESRPVWSGQGRMARGNSSAPDQSAGSGPRPSAAAVFEDWGAGVRAAFAARVQAAKTPQAAAVSRVTAGKSVDLVAGLLAFVAGGDGPPVELVAEFFERGEVNGPISAAGRKRLQRLRDMVPA